MTFWCHRHLQNHRIFSFLLRHGGYNLQILTYISFFTLSEWETLTNNGQLFTIVTKLIYAALILCAFPTRATRLSSLGVGARGTSERLASLVMQLRSCKTQGALESEQRLTWNCHKVNLCCSDHVKHKVKFSQSGG